MYNLRFILTLNIIIRSFFQIMSKIIEFKEFLFFK